MERPLQIRLQPATWDDFDFLWALHQAAMHDYVDRTWCWDPAVQETHFAKSFDPAALQIIHADGVAAGYLSVKRQPESMHLAAIALEPGFQKRGIGTALLRTLMDEAAAGGLPVDLQVLKVNPARQLYERLGFRVYEETETHYRMTTARAFS
jgi:ribosomal protein S18 acetylase RimI-like enzyme